MKKASFSRSPFLFFLAFSPGVCFADLGSEVSGMFDRLGLSGTATPSGVYEGQSRGFITGGSVSVRLPNETVQPLSVSLPHLRSGCGGVDLFLGAISYISADDLIRKMKTIGTSFASYAFMMALKTLCSPCENIMEKLEAASRAANSLSVNTCRAGESLAEGIFGEGGIIRGEQAGRCAFVGVKQSLFTDPAEGLSECRTQSGITSAVADINAGSVTQDKELVKPVRNTVWEALRTIPLSKPLKRTERADNERHGNLRHNADHIGVQAPNHKPRLPSGRWRHSEGIQLRDGPRLHSARDGARRSCLQAVLRTCLGKTPRGPRSYSR